MFMKIRMLIQKMISSHCITWLENGFVRESRHLSAYTHCLYMDLDGKKIATSNLPFQVFEGLIQNQNIFFSNLSRAFLQNPLFVLLLTLIMDLADPGTFSEIF